MDARACLRACVCLRVCLGAGLCEHCGVRTSETDMPGRFRSGPAISCPPFKLIQMNIVREYLDKEFRDVPFCFP